MNVQTFKGRLAAGDPRAVTAANRLVVLGRQGDPRAKRALAMVYGPDGYHEVMAGAHPALTAAKHVGIFLTSAAFLTPVIKTSGKVLFGTGDMIHKIAHLGGMILEGAGTVLGKPLQALGSHLEKGKILP